MDQENKDEYIIGRSLIKKNHPLSPSTKKPILDFLQSTNKTDKQSNQTSSSSNDTIDSDHLHQGENQYTPKQILPPS